MVPVQFFILFNPFVYNHPMPGTEYGICGPSGWKALKKPIPTVEKNMNGHKFEKKLAIPKKINKGINKKFNNEKNNNVNKL